MKKIEVLGPGCARCKETFRVVQQVVTAEGLSVEVVKDESIERMMALGLMATPGSPPVRSRRRCGRRRAITNRR